MGSFLLKVSYPASAMFCPRRDPGEFTVEEAVEPSIPETWSVIVNPDPSPPIDSVEEVVRDFVLVEDSEDDMGQGTSGYGKTPPWLNEGEQETLSEVERLRREVQWWRRRALRAEGFVQRIHDEGENLRGYLDLLDQEWAAHQKKFKADQDNEG